MADRVVPIDESGQRSAGEIMRDLVRDMGDMVRSEIRLAKAEIKESAIQAGKAGGMLGGAALCGLFAAACVVAFCVWLLALAMPWGVAALLMGILLGCGGAALYAGGRGKLKHVDPVPRRTMETLKEPLR